MFATRALRAKIVRTGPAAPPPPPVAPRPPRPVQTPVKPAQSRPSPVEPQPASQGGDRAKSLFQSYMSIAPTARILFGLAVGSVGLAGLYWDRQYPESTPEDGQKLPISVRMVDRVK